MPDQEKNSYPDQQQQTGLSLKVLFGTVFLGILSANFFGWALDRPELFINHEYVFSELVHQVARLYAFLLVIASFIMSLGTTAIIRKYHLKIGILSLYLTTVLYGLGILWILNVSLDWLFPSIFFEKQLLRMSILIGFLLAWKNRKAPTKPTLIISGIYLILIPLVLSRQLPPWTHSLSLRFYLVWMIFLLAWILSMLRSRARHAVPLHPNPGLVQHCRQDACTTTWPTSGHATRPWERLGSIMLCGVALLSLGTERVTSIPASQGPNIVLVVIDTLRADMLHCYGNPAPTSPTMDRIASEGMRFTRVYAPAPWTIPSHASLFTGVSPVIHGARYQNDGHSTSTGRIDPQLKTMAELLRNAGYDTCGITSNGLVSHALGFSKGFRHYSFVEHLLGNPSRNLRILEPWGTILRWRIKGDRQLACLPDGLKNTDRETRAVAAAKDWLENRRNKKRPYFLFVNLMPPHWPYEPPPEHRRLFESPDRQGTSPRSIKLFLYQFDKENPPEIDWDSVRDLYEGEVHYSDALIDEIWSIVKAENSGERSQVIVTSDHGERFGEPPYYAMQHGYFLDEPVLNVPLILWDSKKSLESKVSTALVDFTDLFAHILVEANVPVPSLVTNSNTPIPLIGSANDEKQREILVAVYGEPHITFVQHTLEEHYERLKDRERTKFCLSPKYALYTQDWKLVHNVASDQYELYDLRQAASIPVSSTEDYSEQIRRLRKLLDQWKKEYLPTSQEFVPMDENTEKVMRGLGYF